MTTKPKNLSKTTGRASRGFTLVELLAVIAILGLLMGALMPMIPKMIEKGKRTACGNNLHQIGIALKAYAMDYDGRYPFTAAGDSANKHLALLYPRYVDQRRVFICRSASSRGYSATDTLDPNQAAVAKMMTDGLPVGENCYAYAFGLGGPGTDSWPLLCDQLSDASQGTQRWSSHGLGSNHTTDGGCAFFGDGRAEFIMANPDGTVPASRFILRARNKGENCDPANAAPSPNDASAK